MFGFQKQYLAQNGRRKEYRADVSNRTYARSARQKADCHERGEARRHDCMTKSGCRKLQPPLRQKTITANSGQRDRGRSPRESRMDLDL